MGEIVCPFFSWTKLNPSKAKGFSVSLSHTHTHTAKCTQFFFYIDQQSYRVVFVGSQKKRRRRRRVNDKQFTATIWYDSVIFNPVDQEKSE